MPEDYSADPAWICDLYHLGQMVAREPSSDFALRKILQHFAAKLDAVSGSLALRDDSGDTLTLSAGVGLPEGVIGKRIEFGDSVLGWVAKHAEPLLLQGDVSDDPRFDFSGEKNERLPASSICWPLRSEGRVIGVLCVNRPKEVEPFSDEDMGRAEGLVDHITVVMENVRLYRNQARQMVSLAQANVRIVLLSEVQAKFLQVDKRLEGEDTPDATLSGFFSEFLEDLALIIGAPVGVLALRDNHGKVHTFVSHGLESAPALVIRAALQEESACSQVLDLGNMLNVENLHDDPRCAFLLPLKSLLCVPLQIGKGSGLLFVAGGEEDRSFDDNDELVMGMLSNDLALLIERMNLLSELQHANNELTTERLEQQKLIQKLQEAKEQLLQSEKLASIGQLAAGVAHEINNPVGYITSNISTMKQYVDDLFRLLDAYESTEPALRADEDLLHMILALKEEVDLGFLREDVLDLMNESQEGVKRVKQIVQDLKDFSHVDKGEWEITDLHKGLDSTLNIVNNEIKYKAEVKKEYGEIPPVECLASQLNQVFMNLLVNAAHSIKDRGTITVRTGTADEMVWVEVQDSGKGIAPAHLKKIFDPFFTTKAVGKGTGLGLSLSYGIIKKHGGRIDVDSEVGKGTRFRVWVPIKPIKEEPAPEASEEVA